MSEIADHVGRRWRGSRRLRWAAAVTAIGLGVLTPLASAVPADDGNPDLASSCGLDVTLVLDDSASISSSEADQVRSAAQLFADALVGTPSTLKVATFASRAQGVASNGSLTSNLSSIVFRDPGDYSAPTSGGGSGGTNWDDGLEVVRRSTGGPGDLVVFITDGDPTYRNQDEPDGHANDGSHSLDGNGSSVSTANLDAAVYEASAIKTAGAHMFGIGIGLTDSSSEQRLNDVTGDEELTLDSSGVPNRPFGEADYTIAPNFSQLESIVAAFVRDLCAPSLNVTKFLQKADGTTVPAGAGDPWTFTADVSPAPSAWTSPAGATGASASATTDSSGGVSFKWEGSGGNATVDLSEQAKAGWVYNGARCEVNALDGSDPTVVFDSRGQNQPGASKDASELADLAVGPDVAVNCDVYNRQIRAATIQVTKQTLPAGLADGFDFALASGPTTVDTLSGIAHGETGTFDPVAPGTYSVTEDADPNFDPTSAGCDLLSTQGVEQVSPTSLTVDEGQAWRCTFVNTAHPGTITVVKDAYGANGTFPFTSDVPDLGNFSLTTSPVTAMRGTASTDTITVPVGTYAVAEQVPSRWTLSDAVCTGEQSPSSVFVGPGQDVVCTFSNQAPDATIEVTKTASPTSVAEPGGSVTYTVSVTNTSLEDLWISELEDAIEGAPPIDITQVAGPITATTCDDLVGAQLAFTGPDATATCTFTVDVAGDDGDVIDDVVTVTAMDNNEGEITDSDDASVTITAVAPTISVTKTPSVASIAEPGGTVSYTVEVTNDGVEPVAIDSISDVLEGASPVDVTVSSSPLDAGTCATFVGTVIAPGASKSCTFSIAHVVDRSDLDDGDLDDTVTVAASDDDGSTSATADAEVTVTDVAPTIEVTKTASPTTVAETAPGQTRPVDYVVTIDNTSPEAVSLDAITDRVDGGTPFAAGGTCTALVGTMLAAQTSTSCTFTLGVAGDVNDVVSDVVEVTASDDDGNHVSDQDDASVTFTGLASSIAVTKTASVGSVPEPGGTVTFTVEVTNTSPADTVTIGAITDAVEGATPFAAGGNCPSLIGTALAPGEKAACSFDLGVEGDAGDVVHDTATVTGTDDDGESVSGSADEAVSVTDVASSLKVTKTAAVESVPEPGAAVTYTVVIENTSTADAVTLDSIVDSVQGGTPGAVGGTCAALIGTTLAPGGSTSCTFSMTVSGDAGDVVGDTVTVAGTDDDEAPVSASDSAVVDVVDVASALTVVKTPSVDSLPEPGGTVTYTVDITNTSTADAIVLDSITDAVAGGSPAAPGGTCDALVGTTLDPGQKVTCTFTLAVAGDAGDSVPDTVVVAGTDDDEAPVTGSDSAVVDITDVPPTGTVTKVADVDTIPEPGSPVTFTASVTNTSTAEAATVTAITDLVDGTPIDVTAVGGIVTATTCATGAVLAPGATYSCTFTLAITGVDAGDVVSDQVSFTLIDDDGGSVEPSDTAAVTVTDVVPTISVTKDNGGAEVAAPGANVVFDVTVANTSTAEPVVLTALTDSVEGATPFDITTTTGPVVSTDCATGGTIAIGGTYSCQFTLAVESDDPTAVTDVVEAAATDDEGNLVTAGDDAITTVTPVADLAIDNRLAPSGGQPQVRAAATNGLEVGTPGTFELEVTNGGPSTSVNLVVTDEMPAELVATAAAGDGWACSIPDGLVTCQRPELASGGSSTITVTVDVTEAASGQRVETVATVSADTPDPDLSNNTDPEAAEVPLVGPSDEESTTTTAVTTTSVPGGVGPSNVDDGTLPRTGSEPRPLVAWALVLVSVGAAVLAWRRTTVRGGPTAS
ncbi:MAG: DUF11 domain-containing protein [Acidimicrobiales bacterium]|nr:DUF11 domain-containing protein [Acidimicrobiales bacterium]